MAMRYRIITLLTTGIMLLIVGLKIESNFHTLISSFWFSSGILLVILLTLIDQPFFSKDSNIFVNAITASISLLLVNKENQDILYYFFIIYVIYLLISSLSLMFIRKNSLYEENLYVQLLSRLNRLIGKPDVIFSIFFLWGAIKRYGIDSVSFFYLFIILLVFKLLSSPEIFKTICKFFDRKIIDKEKNIGSIIGVQSQNTFIVKLNENSKNIDLFRFVEFKCSVDDKVRRGLICDIIYLDKEQWIKIITNNEIDKLFLNQNKIEKHVPDHVYLVDEIPCDFIDRFVGIVTEGSSIGKIKFIYNSKIQIAEGDLLEIIINNQKVLYQIIEGKTQVEQLVNRNQSGCIIGDAVQLGKWDIEKSQFYKYGWVPQINYPIYLASDIGENVVNDDEMILGYLPGTNYPVIINKEIAVTHHMAIIGVTGTGKSVFSRNIVREYLRDENVRVICIDFTGEYCTRFSDLEPKIIINETHADTILNDIDWIDKEEAKFANQRNNNELETKKNNVNTLITASITEFLQGENGISVFELPEVENTSGVMTYTQYFFRALFKIAKTNNNFGKRVCLVLEEAHTIIPEWNSAGISDKVSQPLINSIAQIALQGRKYNIGLLVIAQRTANVSKTILTQCNSIISFQEYDRTTIDFLSNYFGPDVASTLTKLKFRQAVAGGKAFKSSVPLIFEIPEIIED